jgi:hypothetical protein
VAPAVHDDEQLHRVDGELATARLVRLSTPVSIRTSPGSSPWPRKRKCFGLGGWTGRC